MSSSTNLAEQEEVVFPSNMSALQIIEQLHQIQNQYYADNKKNIFMKKTQKLDCAAQTAKQFDTFTLFQCSTFNIPNTNKIFLDYTVFKLFANPSNYGELVGYLIDLVNSMILKHGVFEMHVNMDSFTVSAAERYVPLVRSFCSECLKDPSLTRIDKMSQLYVYNTPNLINNIAPIMLKVCDPAIRNKMTYYSKKESPALMQEVLRCNDDDFSQKSMG
jgi:hypothetical protein